MLTVGDRFPEYSLTALGASVDNEFVHYAWRIQHEDLMDLPFPMLSDVKRNWQKGQPTMNATELMTAAA